MPKSNGFKSILQTGGKLYDGGVVDQWGGARTRSQTRMRGVTMPSVIRDAGEGTSRNPNYSSNPIVTPEDDSSMDEGEFNDAIQTLSRPRARRGRKRKTPRPPRAPRPPRVPNARFASMSRRDWLNSIRPSAASLRVPPPGLKGNQDAPLNVLLRAMGVRRRRGNTVPHHHVVGWYLHGKKGGDPRKGRKATLLRQGVQLALNSYKKGHKKLSVNSFRGLGDFPQWQRGGFGRRRRRYGRRRGQKGGILPALALPALGALAPALGVAGKTLGLGLLAGGGSALGGGLINKLF